MVQMKSLVKQIAIAAVTAPVAMALDNPEPPANQGTIGRQRPILTDYSNTGWLSDHDDPRFWFWELSNLEANGAYTPSTNRYPGARRWVHFDLNETLDYFDDLNGEHNIANAAAAIVARIEARIQSGDLASIDSDSVIDSETFALFIKDIGFPGDLLSHESDKLMDLPDTPTGTPYGEDPIYPWEYYINGELRDLDSEYKGSPWRSEGVADHREFFEALVAEVQRQIEIYNNDETHLDKIPIPSRFIVDHELNWGLGNGREVIAVYNSTIRDSTRFSSETLFGDFMNWTSSPDPKASDIMGGFNPDYSTTQHTWYTYAPIPNSLSDVNQLRDMTTHRSMINAIIDGVFEASIESPLHTTWPGVKWSNYEVSGWYTEQYPMFIRSRNGALAPNLWNPNLYGWNFRAWNGSADMQSPVLYPPDPSHTSEFENPDYPGTASTDDQVMEAGVRLSRLLLDHAIFSFEDIAQAPRHIAPWVPHVGSPVNDDAPPEFVSKKYTRDIIALCKAKGVNEILFWGNSTTHSESKPRWIATNDALSQVWDYNLKRVVVWPGNTALSTPDLTEMTYSEEHTFDLGVLDTTSTSVTAHLEVEFDVEESLNAGTEYTLILETLDGGGPWSDAEYTVKIRNFQTGQFGAYEPVAAVYEEMNDISTRRVVFSDDPDDTDTLYDDWAYEFDDESSSIPNVQDRKSIHKWIITLPSGSLNDYLYEHSTQGWKKMKFQITATHDSPPSFGQPDPLRIDLLQLYESELIDNNVMPSVTIQSTGSDLNNDGMIDVLDLMHYIRVLSIDKSDPSLDINQDGRLNEDDLDELVTHLKIYHLE